MISKYAIVQNQLVELYDGKDPYVKGVMNKYSALLLDGIIYKKISKNTQGTGFYEEGPFLVFVKDNNDIEDFKYDNVRSVDFTDANSISDILNNRKKFEEMESAVLESPDKIFKPRIKEDDLPEMIGLKESVNLKGIDKDKYSYRFGDNFNNDIRLFDKNTISLPKLKTIAENLDIDVYLTFKDKAPDVPNPMGKEVTVKVTNITINEEE